MKLTLLEMTQKVLTVMDSEDINSLSDSVEAIQVANIIEDVYFGIIAARLVPEHKELLKLVALSDSNFPTHFEYGDRVKEVTSVYYNMSEVSGETEWREICWTEPEEFLRKTDGVTATSVLVADKNASTMLTIGTDQYPLFYTSFDEEHIVMNSYKSTIDSTLQESKSRAYGTKYPTFSITDAFVPDLPALMFPYFLAESKSMCLSILKNEQNPKVEQQARRLKNWIQNDLYKTKKDGRPAGYGR
ncbi:MAG: hypothetical protein JKY50_00105 [Oleispira sp.]|nr:hypothetical protein [Oleispira sp.]